MRIRRRRAESLNLECCLALTGGLAVNAGPAKSRGAIGGAKSACQHHSSQMGGGPMAPPRVGGQWVQSAPSLLCECSFPSGGPLAIRRGPGSPGLLHVPPAEEAKAEEQHPSPQTPRELHPELPTANTQPHKWQATPSGHHQAGGVLERTAFVLRLCYQESREKRSWGWFGPSLCRSQSEVQLWLTSLCSAPRVLQHLSPARLRGGERSPS